MLINIYLFRDIRVPSGWAVTRIQKSKLEVHFKHKRTIVRVSSSEVMVHGQMSGICWHSSSMSSQFGGRFSDFCGIYIIFKFNTNIEIEKGMTVLGANFQKFGCE